MDPNSNHFDKLLTPPSMLSSASLEMTDSRHRKDEPPSQPLTPS